MQKESKFSRYAWLHHVPQSRFTWRCIIATDKAQTWAYTEDFFPESAPLETARGQAEEFAITPVSPGEGATLRFIAASLKARSVVELGTGTGVSGLWLLDGMDPQGVLTTIDVEAELQRSARKQFVAAGYASQRVRTIAGRALDVLPRLADSTYDLVLIDADPAEASDCFDQALRILRPGGVAVVTHALWHDRVPDPARRDPGTVAMRELAKRVRDDETLLPLLLPVGGGLLAAALR